jgi:hypothetical protein
MLPKTVASPEVLGLAGPREVASMGDMLFLLEKA